MSRGAKALMIILLSWVVCFIVARQSWRLEHSQRQLRNDAAVIQALKASLANCGGSEATR